MKKTSRFVAALLLLAAPLLAQNSGYQSLLSRSKRFMDSNRAQDALTAAQQAIKVNPAGWEGYVAAATAYKAQSRKEDAIEMLQRAQALAPPDKRDAVRAALADLQKQVAAPDSFPSPPPSPPQTSGTQTVPVPEGGNASGPPLTGNGGPPPTGNPSELPFDAVGAARLGIYATSPANGPWTVVMIEGGSPAETAGLQGGDIIQTLQGTPVRGGQRNFVAAALAKYPAGARVQLGLIRGNNRMTVAVTLNASPFGNGRQ